MKFIVVLICIAINRYWMGSHPFRGETWFDQALQKASVSSTLSSLTAVTRFLFVIGVPVLLATLLFWLLRHWIWGLVWMAGALMVLAYSIDISDLDSVVTEHLSWLRKQQTAVTLDSLNRQHETAMQALVHDEFSKIYPVLFWFMAVGPGGALLYRLSTQYSTSESCSEEDRSIAATVIHLLDWIPVRITGLAFGVVGLFAHCINRLVDSLFEWQTPTKDLLFDMAELAIAVNKPEPADTQQFQRKAELQMKAIQELLHRSLLFWIALIAIFTVVGWG